MMNHYYIEKQMDFQAKSNCELISRRQRLLDAYARPEISERDRKSSLTRYSLGMERELVRPRHLVRVGRLTIAW